MPRVRAPTIIAALDSPRLFGRVVDFGAPSFAAWRACTKAMHALPMTDAELAIYRECTGRDAAPTEPAREVWLVVGHRGGKSRMVALHAVYLATLRDYSAVLAPGERGIVMVVASDRKQARIILNYVRKTLHAVPQFKSKIIREQRESIDLDNDISIEVATCSTASVRGYTIVAALADEIAKWRSDESAHPDVDVLAALRPGMATTKGTLFCISSPYARKGAMFEAHEQYYGVAGDVLIWRAPTRRMNPTIDPREIERAYARDSIDAATEFGAEFRSDVSGYVTLEAVRACVSPGIRERAPVSGQSYFAFVDIAGGSGSDSFALAVAHRDREARAVLDLIREWRPPFKPSRVIEEACRLLKQYRCVSVAGDKYAGGFGPEQFSRNGIRYEPTARDKSTIYRDAISVINSGACALLDDAKLIAQICSLECSPGSQGRDAIDHPRGSHDDLANAGLGALTLEMLDERKRRADAYIRGIMRLDPAQTLWSDMPYWEAYAFRNRPVW